MHALNIHHTETEEQIKNMSFNQNIRNGLANLHESWTKWLATIAVKTVS